MNKYVSTILNIADQKIITLPERVAVLRAARDRLQDRASTLPPVADVFGADLDSAQRLIDTVIAAATTDDDALDTVDWSAPRVQRAADEDRRAALAATRAALVKVEGTLQEVLASTGEALTLSMQARFNKALTRYRAGLQVAQQWPDHAPQYLASAAVLKTLADTASARSELDALIAVREALRALEYRASTDEFGEFDLCPTMNKVWPRGSRQGNARPPWGDQDRIDWLLTNGADIWLPTSAQQDQRYDDVYAELIAAVVEQNKRTHAMTSGFSGAAPTYAPVPDVPDRPVRPAPTPREQALSERIFDLPAEGE